jgi:glycosyltransferase involved in cell wall biosynthesis
MPPPDPEPRVTVFVPTYNRAAFAREAIESVLGQTDPDFVLVVADNASTDDTPEMVSSFADERIRYVRRPENLGLLGNFNSCLEDVRTRYCLIVCDDDRLHPDFLSTTVPLLDERDDVGMVHTAFRTVDDAGDIVDGHTDWMFARGGDAIEPGAEFLVESMKYGCRVCSSAALMRTSALPRPAFEQGDFPAIDFGLWLRMAVDWKIAFVDRPLADYRIHESSQSAEFGPAAGSGYRAGVEWVRHRELVKIRFLDQHQQRVANGHELRQLVPRSRRHELLAIARAGTLPERRASTTIRRLAWAVRADPGVARELAAWRLLAASLLPTRVRERLRHGPA